MENGNGAGQAGDESGSTEKVDGAFMWNDAALKPVAGDSGVTGYRIVFTPSDTVNYETAEGEVTLEVKKADIAPNMPDSAMEVTNSCEKVSSVALPEGWEWQEADREKTLEAGKTVSAVAVYTGEDSGNYEKETVTVAITRAVCGHTNTETRNAKAATCQETGYTGDTWCTDCGELLAAGKEIPLTHHQSGTATCIRRAACTVCGQEYGTLDAGNHEGSTEVRNSVAASCTEGGYIGDVYCMGCDVKLNTGMDTPALGHDYKSEVTKEPTEDSEGIRTYTCIRCSNSYTESIDRLEPSNPESTPEPGDTPEPGSTPGPSDTPKPGNRSEPSVTLKPSDTPEPSSTPEPGTTPGPSNTPEPERTPGPSNTPKPERTPGPSNIPEPGKPFIKGVDGKTGWDVIRAEEVAAEEGSAIHVDMNGTTVVPGDILDSIRGRDITVTFDMGGGILWSVDGKQILTEQEDDIDFSVKTGTNAIPIDIVNNVTGERYSIQVSLSHNGEFGFTVVLFINFGKGNAGLTASMYYYNQSTGKLEFTCADKIAEDGTASLTFTHASDYIIVIGESREKESGNTQPTQPGNTQTPTGADGNASAAKESPRTGQERKTEWPMAAGILILAGASIAALLAWRKKERGEK